MIINRNNIDRLIDGTTMVCSSRNITSIEYIPDNITGLYCGSNKLTQLPNFPDSLIELYCHYNQLTQLPKLPDSLTELYCYNNQLTSYPNHSRDKQWWLNHNKQINRSIIIKHILTNKFV